MNDTTQELLANFVRNGSEFAFRELVTSYLDLVYSTAIRLVDGDTHRAEDVSQIVFADLARMACKLSERTMLGGWLHRHTCFVARTVMRGERRRQTRERQAAEMNALNDQDDSVLAQIAPLLDEAIQELGADDRDAILLRFYERRNLRAVGEALGTSENVAQKRVSRALHELGILLQRRGVAFSASALASGLAAEAVTVAPAGLALGISGSVFAGAGAAGGGLTSAKVALMAKFKTGIVGVLVVAGVVTAIFLQTQPKARVQGDSPLVPKQPVQPGPVDLSGSTPNIQESASSSPNDQLRQTRIASSQLGNPGNAVVVQPTRQSAAVVEKPLAENPGPPIRRFFSRSGSKVRIEGTSSIHDWQAESHVIGGFLELGPGFSVGPGWATKHGPVQAHAEAFITVRSLKSVDKSGSPFSDQMDQLMYESLRAKQNPRIHYRLVAMSLSGTTNYNNVVQYVFESRGELAIAGITNEITMPVFVFLLGDGKLRVRGRTSIKMTLFEIEPPASGIGNETLFQTGDDVAIEFDWIVASKGVPSTQTQSGMVPLILDLPAPAFKGTPKDLQLGPDVEPLSDKPRAPLIVPSGLMNLAPESKVTSSDANASADFLARIVDGDKSASDQSIIFLRKGTQWVQMDLGSPQELFALVIWHAHNAAKLYHDVIVQASDDRNFIENVQTLFNNDKDNSSGRGFGTDREYFETYEGKLINAKGVKARYVRFYSKGSTESALNEYTEIEVYGRQAQAQSELPISITK